MIEYGMGQRLANGENVYGLFSELLDPLVVELIGQAGFDYVVFENEHGLRNPETLVTLIRTAELAGVAPLIRIGGGNPIITAQFLDMGAAGFVVPHVQTRADAEEFVSWCRYPPEGKRGTGFRRGVPTWGIEAREAEVQAMTNKRLMVWAIIEDPEGVENIREILSVDGLSGVAVGYADLALELGVPVDDPKVQLSIERVREAVRDDGRKHLLAGMKDVEALRGTGAHAFSSPHDSFLLADVLRRTREAMAGK